MKIDWPKLILEILLIAVLVVLVRPGHFGLFEKKRIELPPITTPIVIPAVPVAHIATPIAVPTAPVAHGAAKVVPQPAPLVEVPLPKAKPKMPQCPAAPAVAKNLPVDSIIFVGRQRGYSDAQIRWFLKCLGH